MLYGNNRRKVFPGSGNLVGSNKIPYTARYDNDEDDVEK